MNLLECRRYSRNEIEGIFHTDRMDSIRRSLDRAGYKYEITGRGQKAVLTIIEQPPPLDPFAAFVIKELGYGTQSRFDAMKRYYQLLLSPSDFRYYPATYQVKLMKKCNFSVTDQTLRNWKKRLLDAEWIVENITDCRYYLCRKGERPQRISHQEFIEAWSEYHKSMETGEDSGEAMKNMINKCGGSPKKYYGFYESALARELIDQLHSLLDQ